MGKLIFWLSYLVLAKKTVLTNLNSFNFDSRNYIDKANFLNEHISKGLHRHF